MMNPRIIGNPNGMDFHQAGQIAQHIDRNRNRLVSDDIHIGADAHKILDKNRDQRVDVGELAVGLARGDVFIDTQTHTVGAFNKGVLHSLFN